MNATGAENGTLSASGLVEASKARSRPVWQAPFPPLMQELQRGCKSQLGFETLRMVPT